MRGLSAVPAAIVMSSIIVGAALMTLAILNLKKAAELRLEYKQAVLELKLRSSMLSVARAYPTSSGCEILLRDNTTLVLRKGEYRIVRGAVLYCMQDKVKIVPPSID